MHKSMTIPCDPLAQRGGNSEELLDQLKDVPFWKKEKIKSTDFEHAVGMMKKMFDYACNSKLCDVILVAGDKKIGAHKLVLSVASDYFSAMFSGKMQESNANEVTLENVDPNALYSLIRFIYTGILEIKEDNVESLLATACMLQLDKVRDYCCNFLMKELHLSNCIGIRKFASLHSCTELCEAATNFFMDHFTNVVHHEEFFTLDVEDFGQILASDDLNVKSEEEVFDILIKWIQHDEIERKQHVPYLLHFLRLPLLNLNFLVDHVQTHELVVNNSECSKLFVEALKYHLLAERRQSLQNSRTKPRKSTVGHLYTVGGTDPNSGSTTIEKYQLRCNKWEVVAKMSGRRLQFGVAVLDNKLYVVGGRDGLKTMNTVECFDPLSNQWSFMPSMNTHRHGLGVAGLNGPLYAVGGHDGWSYLNTVERWDPSARSWNYVSPMTTSRSCAGVTVLDTKLYVVGGRDGSSCLKSMECFDPHTNRWSVCAPMNKRRGGIGVATLNMFLYAVGGHGAPSNDPMSSKLDLVERYDPKTDTWTTIAPISSGRDAVGACVLASKLYVVGGFDSQYIDKVERYDPETDEWEAVCNLKQARAGACLVHVPNRSNLQNDNL